MASGTMSAGKSEASISQKNNLDALVLDLTCPICLQLFSEPVSLPCGHIYCFGCLKTVGQGLDQHRCPECLKEFHGTEALVKNFKMCSIVETYKATAQKVESIANPLDVSHSVAKSTDSAAEEENTRYHKGITTADGGQTERKDGFQIGSGSSEQPSSIDQEQDKAKMEMDEPPIANRLDVAYSAAKSTDSAAEEENTRYHKGIATVDGGQMERKDGFQIGSGSSEQPSSLDQEQDKAKLEMDEPKFRLASQVTELSLMLEMAESVLTKEQEQESEISATNGQLREKTSKLLGQMKELLQSYSAQVMQLIEEELGPGEASLTGRVNRASEKTNQLRHAMLRAESLLTEQDETEFNEELRTLQPHIVELLAKPVGEEEKCAESNIGVTRACPKLEAMSTELRERIGEIQRSLRNTFNPSEVTFDPETAHPNLILSDDLKTVTFSTTKQPYPPSPQRFTSFFQVLSSQSFTEGEHCWEVELEVSPWLIGVCYSGKLARSGLTSALESSRSSWCLMWFNNLLTAFEQSHSVPLKRTTVSRKLEIRLSFKTHRLSFYNVSPVSGKTHVYTFKANLTEPVHLAYRMMSGHPKGSVTINS